MNYFRKNNTIGASLLGLSLIGLSACSGMNSGDIKSSEVEISGQFNGVSSSSSQSSQKIAGNLAMLAAASDYSISCMTLTSPAATYSAAIQADGIFKLKLPAGTSVGCFIVNSASQSPVASLYIEAEQKTMGTSLSSSLNLSKDVNLGELNIDFENREVRIPKARVSDASTPAKPNALQLQDLHEQTYILKCVETGNAVLDADCKQKLESDNANNTVFFRVLKAVQDGKDIQGLGVWESKKAFNDCGAIDLSAQDAAGALQNDNITFPYADKVTVGGNFILDDVLCPARNQHGPTDTWMNIRKYYALGGVDTSSDGYTLHTENEDYWSDNCKIKHQTVVHFSGKNSEKLTGQFYQTTKKLEYVQGACENYQEEDNHFIIELTKVK
jgi:hypothetical protein